ncbi:MAG: hypothetical protein DBP02_17765 [gamma proteobacterium symbiont of Ctena orbiculata]|nr:MAG: hypothetical protein DBP02_17765 [gamma proteobacterium symbiont of Ctena orbiculata]
MSSPVRDRRLEQKYVFQSEESMKSTLRSLLADKAVMDELRGDITTMQSMTESISDESGQTLDALLEQGEAAISPLHEYTNLEAIILLRGRPVLLIQKKKWEEPPLQEIRKWLGDAEDPENELVRRIPSVGRIEVIGHSSDYIGTGWMLAEDVLVTNRHVVREFGLRKGGGFDFRINPEGDRYSARVDFLREYNRSNIAQVGIEEILFIEDNSDVRPDMALLRLSRGDGKLPAPIELDDSPLTLGPDDKPKLAVIGYPAEDGRNDAFAMRNIFKGIYRVKRLSPGRVMSVSPNGKVLEHDCTTLGGNSGSPVINLESGKACGLHYAGTYRERNLAVTAPWLKSRLREIAPGRTFILKTPSGTVAEIESDEERVRPPEDLAGRKGYHSDFLGEGFDLEVPLPQVSDEELRAKIAPVVGQDDGLLHYTHFSILMRKDRRMPFFTACNIDGQKLFNFPRGWDKWSLDGRLKEEYQNGEDLYRRNKLDRGHLVRRLDPVWGDKRAEAKQAEQDTFVFTNCMPQHSQLNQRDWLRLEDYVLGNADTRDFKVSVFTGPVMADNDIDYRGAKIPREYWKVTVMVNRQTEQLSATGYLLSQGDFLRDIEFVYGEFRTYQVALAEIEKKTGLVFDLSLYDPLGAVEGSPYRELTLLGDIVL